MTFAGKKWTIWRASLAGICVLAAVPSALAGAPFVTDDPEPVDLGHFEITLASQYAQHKDETSGTLPSLEINYGAAPEMDFHVTAPLAFKWTAGDGTRLGNGDTELGSKYRFIREDDKGWRPAVAVFPLVLVPTGDERRGLGTGHTRVFLPLWLQKTFDPWTTFGGGGYWINPGSGNRNFWFVGWAVVRQMSKTLSLGAELFHQTADTIDAKDTTAFNVGGTYDLTENHHFKLSIGRAIQNSAQTNQLSFFIAYRLTF